MRDCGSCTKCCDGWLTGQVAGEYFYPGKPCIFCNTGKGCISYDTRPVDPCINYSCAWLLLDDFPEDFKPSDIGMIVSINRIGSYQYAELVPAGNKLDSKMLSWFIVWGLRKYGNIVWLDDERATYHLGSEGFSNMITTGRDTPR